MNAHDTGVIAQEVQKILPEAVTSAGSIVLPDGTKFENFLLVDKVSQGFEMKSSMLPRI